MANVAARKGGGSDAETVVNSMVEQLQAVERPSAIALQQAPGQIRQPLIRRHPHQRGAGPLQPIGQIRRLRIAAGDQIQLATDHRSRCLWGC